MRWEDVFSVETSRLVDSSFDFDAAFLFGSSAILASIVGVVMYYTPDRPWIYNQQVLWNRSANC
jgi:hypothetical protein